MPGEGAPAIRGEALEKLMLQVVAAQEVMERFAYRVDVDVLQAVRTADEDGFLSPSAVPTSTAVDRLVTQLLEAAATSLGGMSLHDLVRQGDAPPADPSPTPTAPA